MRLGLTSFSRLSRSSMCLATCSAKERSSTDSLRCRLNRLRSFFFTARMLSTVDTEVGDVLLLLTSPELIWYDSVDPSLGRPLSTPVSAMLEMEAMQTARSCLLKPSADGRQSSGTGKITSDPSRISHYSHVNQWATNITQPVIQVISHHSHVNQWAINTTQPVIQVISHHSHVNQWAIHTTQPGIQVISHHSHVNQWAIHTTQPGIQVISHHSHVNQWAIHTTQPGIQVISHHSHVNQWAINTTQPVIQVISHHSHVNQWAIHTTQPVIQVISHVPFTHELVSNQHNITSYPTVISPFTCEPVSNPKNINGEPWATHAGLNQPIYWIIYRLLLLNDFQVYIVHKYFSISTSQQLQGWYYVSAVKQRELMLYLGAIKTMSFYTIFWDYLHVKVVNVNVTDTILWQSHHDRVMQLNWLYFCGICQMMPLKVGPNTALGCNHQSICMPQHTAYSASATRGSPLQHYLNI